MKILIKTTDWWGRYKYYIDRNTINDENNIINISLEDFIYIIKALDEFEKAQEYLENLLDKNKG